jgi:hypothetical protein
MPRADQREETKLVRRDRTVTRTALEEYVTFLRRPRRVFWTNLLVGVARGMGAVLGATVVIALLLLLLTQLTQVPVVGEYFRWIAEQIRHPG